MKSAIIIFTLLIANVSSSFCQKNDLNNMSPKTVISNLKPPCLKDYKKFKEEFPLSKLVPVYQILSRDNLLYTYTYSFEVNKKGKIIPFQYYQNNQFFLDNKKLFMPLIKYFSHTFNKYQWEPGYKKTCKRLKEKTFIKFSIHFSTDIKKINVTVNMIHLNDVIGLYSLNYDM